LVTKGKRSSWGDTHGRDATKISRRIVKGPNGKNKRKREKKQKKGRRRKRELVGTGWKYFGGSKKCSIDIG